MASIQLADIAFARSGDKGDTADLSLFAADADGYEILVEHVTAERVKRILGRFVRGEVRRYEVPNVLALKFVCEEALGGGGPASLRADNLGKALAGALLWLELDLPDDVAARLSRRDRAPRDPYRGADWRVVDGGLERDVPR